ncbi:MAG: DUF992 domain-containing protein [Pseudomonadota bacterium]
MNIRTLITIFAVGSLLLLPAGITSAQERVELGNMECFVDEGTGFIFGSTKDISCVFTSIDGEEDNYFGVINKFGIDIGTTEQSYITWLVIAPTVSEFEKGFLAGDYIGATASATFAVGLGANALVGGSTKSFALQPLSVGTQTGLNLAAGVAEMELRSVE